MSFLEIWSLRIIFQNLMFELVSNHKNFVKTVSLSFLNFLIFTVFYKTIWGKNSKTTLYINNNKEVRVKTR